MESRLTTFDLVGYHQMAQNVDGLAALCELQINRLNQGLALANDVLMDGGPDGDGYGLDTADEYDMHQALDVIRQQLRRIRHVTGGHVQRLADELVPSPPQRKHSRVWCPRCRRDVPDAELIEHDAQRHAHCGQAVRYIPARSAGAAEPATPAPSVAPAQLPRLRAVTTTE
jgi:hypothetical protein